MTTYSVEDIAEIRAQGDLGQLWAAVRAETAAENARRRAAVLAHPDLAARLTEPPLRFTAPERWTGYIPPATWGGSRLHDQPNPAPERRALLALVAEAEARTARRAA